MLLTVRSILTITLLMVTACGDQQAPAGQHKPAPSGFIVAVNTPLQYFARRLLDGEIEVRILAPANTDPAQWLPSADDVLQLQQAQLILLNGAGYSSWMNKVSVSENRLVDTSSAALDSWIALEGQVSHSHGPQGEHAHGGYAVTTWMDMSMAQIQAEGVAHALREQWPEKRENIDSKLVALLANLRAIDAGFIEAATRLRDRQLVYSHPVYQYFARRYELPGVSLHWEPDLMPREEQWSELERLRAEGMLFIWEAEPATEIADRMREAGIEFVVLDPAANSGEKDWIAVQRENVARMSP